MGQYGPETKKPSLLTPYPLMEHLNAFDYYNEFFVEFLLRKLPNLKLVDVGEECLNRTRVFALFNLKSLEILRIGMRSFYLGDQERSDGLFHIADCPKLSLIQIDHFSFADYQEMTLENLPSLESIYLGTLSFLYAPLFSLTGFAFSRGRRLDLPQLQAVQLSGGAFSYVHTIAMESIPLSAVANRLAKTHLSES